MIAIFFLSLASVLIYKASKKLTIPMLPSTSKLFNNDLGRVLQPYHTLRQALKKRYGLLLFLLLIPFDNALAQPKKNSITCHGTAAALWGLGAATLAAKPLAYYFFPFTYVCKINKHVAYTQFVMYRYEHYRDLPKESIYNIWRQFHEFYFLPGLRYSPHQDPQQGTYFSFHAGFGGGKGPNLEIWTINFMPEVGYVAQPFYKQLYWSFNCALLFSAPLQQVPRRYTWDQFSVIGVLSHMITPLFGVNIGLVF